MMHLIFQVIASGILAIFALICFLKNIGIYDDDRAVIGFTIFEALILIFIGLVMWNVL